MTETVTVTPQSGLDAYDNPQTAGTPITLRAMVAPTDTSVEPGPDGNLDTVAFTVYLPLRIKQGSAWVRTVSALTESFTIAVRGRTCVGRAREWNEGGRGGVEVLATSETGASRPGLDRGARTR